MKKLSDLMPINLALAIPVIVKNDELVLVKPIGQEFAFLLWNREDGPRATHCAFMAGGENFYFVCWCNNCITKGGQYCSPEQSLKEITLTCKQHGIHEVATRYFDGCLDGILFSEICRHRYNRPVEAKRWREYYDFRVMLQNNKDLNP